MVTEPLNDRFATIEDIFVKFVVPKLQTDCNDMYYLYTKQKDLCPNVQQIKDGFDIYYMPRRLHNSIYNGIRDNNIKIINALKNYYRLAENDDQINENKLFSTIQAGGVSNTDLKYTIIDAFRYINSTYIAKEPAFQSYASIINTDEFMSDKSSVASDNTKIINLSFAKLS